MPIRIDGRRIIPARRPDPGELTVAIDEALTHLHLASAGVDRWQIPDDFAVIEAGLRRTYTRGRRNLQRSIVHPTDDQLHEWRKDVKALWYQVRLIEACAPRPLGTLGADLDRIGRLLGSDQDLRLLTVDTETAATLLAGRRHRLQSQAVRRGRIVFAESPDCFGGRVSAYWAAEQELGSA